MQINFVHMTVCSCFSPQLAQLLSSCDDIWLARHPWPTCCWISSSLHDADVDSAYHFALSRVNAIMVFIKKMFNLKLTSLNLKLKLYSINSVFPFVIAFSIHFVLFLLVLIIFVILLFISILFLLF